MPAGPCSFPETTDPRRMSGFLCARNSLASMTESSGGTPQITLDRSACLDCRSRRLALGSIHSGWTRMGLVWCSARKSQATSAGFPTSKHPGPNRCTRKVVHFPTSAFPGKNGSLTGAACGLRPSHEKFFMVIGCEAELYLHKLQAETKRVSELTRSISERCQSRLTWSRACAPCTCLAHFGRTCTGLDRGVSGDPVRGGRELLVLCGGRDEQQGSSC